MNMTPPKAEALWLCCVWRGWVVGQSRPLALGLVLHKRKPEEPSHALTDLTAKFWGVAPGLLSL